MGKRKKPVKALDSTEPQACPFPPKLVRNPTGTLPLPRAFQLQHAGPFFKLGKWGMPLLVLSLALIIFIQIFDPLIDQLWSFLNWNPFVPSTGINLISTINLGLFAISMTLSGFIFLNHWRETGSRLALCIGLSFILSIWWFVCADLLRYTGLVGLINYPYNPSIEWTFFIGPLYPLFFLLLFIGLTSLLTTMILWAIGMIRIPIHPEHRQITMVTCSLCLFAVLMFLFTFVNVNIEVFMPAPSVYDLWRVMFWSDLGINGNMSSITFVHLILPASLLSYIVFHQIPPRSEMDIEVTPPPQVSKTVVNPQFLHSTHLIYATMFVTATSWNVLNTLRGGGILGVSTLLTILIGSVPLLVLAFNWYKLITNPNQQFLALSFFFFGFVVFLGFNFTLQFWDTLAGGVFFLLGITLTIHLWLPTRNWESQTSPNKTSKIPGEDLSRFFIIFGVLMVLLTSVNQVVILTQGPFYSPLDIHDVLRLVIFPIIGYLIGLVFLIIGFLLFIRGKRTGSESTNTQLSGQLEGRPPPPGGN